MEPIYLNKVCYVASMHKKEAAIALPFEKFLGCKVLPSAINTDLLGTFTGEVERWLDPKSCAKEKCSRALDQEHGTLGVSSEGSFGPHPENPFISAGFEILYFSDRNLGFELTLTKISRATNFAARSIQNIDELSQFAKKTLFPSHALILRPEGATDSSLIFKGIQDEQRLYSIFEICSKYSKKRQVWAETDMRAHMNPTRMKNIEELACEMALRLAIPCPACRIPGWGIREKISGLPCKVCRTPTNLIQLEIYGCCLCEYKETHKCKKEPADPEYCLVCNP